MQYCGEHQPAPADPGAAEEGVRGPLRVPCPYDPKHTCFQSKLEKHLKICNSKPPAVLPPYLVPAINAGDPPTNTNRWVVWTSQHF